MGKLASMSRREVERLIREWGGQVVERDGVPADLVIVGDETVDLKRVAADPEVIDEATRLALERGESELVRESEFWARLGLVDAGQGVARLYTPAMLADLIRVPISAIRHWARRGALRPAREVRRLPYFDFEEVGVARKLAQLLAAGCSLSVINRKLDELARLLPELPRPLADPTVVVEGRCLRVRRDEGMAEPSGQLLIDFEEAKPQAAAWRGREFAGGHSDCRGRSFEVCRRTTSGSLRTTCGRWRPTWSNRAIAIRRSRPCGQFWCRASSRRTIISRWPSCCIAAATCRPPASVITWPSRSTRILSRPARIWAACWPSKGSSSLPRRRFSVRSNIIRTMPTRTIIWHDFWIGWINRALPCDIGSDLWTWRRPALGRTRRGIGLWEVVRAVN